MITNTSILPNIISYVLDEIEQNYKRNNQFTDNDLLVIHNTFGNIAEKAFEIVEKDSVKKICLQGGTRFIYEVAGSSNKIYYLFPDNNFCLCTAYWQYVVKQRTQVTCKHILACRFAAIINKIMVHYISVSEFKELQKLVIDSQNHS